MLLSICIPSYNRFDNLQKIIDSILKCKLDDYQIVIHDNNSPESILKKVDIYNSKKVVIKTSRCSILPNDNYVRTLASEDSKYSLLLFDKDYLDGKYLQEFITVLKNNQSITGGYCNLNKYSGSNGYIIKRFNPKDCYIQHHPSGYFFRNDIILEDKSVSSIEFQRCAFYADMLLTRCFVNGPILYFDYPMIFTETLDNARKIKSYSYSESNKNLYFSVENRIKQFEMFVIHLNTLKFDLNNKKKIVYHLYFQTLHSITIDLKDIYSNSDICQHYRTHTEDISFNMMIKNVKIFDKYILRCQFIKDLCDSKRKMIIKGNVYIRLAIIKDIMKNCVKSHKG
jgi:glycosyltransferase involved in cell wall biosynthesis